MNSGAVKRATVRTWTLADSYSFIATFLCRHSYSTSAEHQHQPPQNQYQYHHQHQQYPQHSQRRRQHDEAYLHSRHFHDYFVTHLPRSSLHPDSGASSGPHHKLPRSASMPHTSSQAGGPSPATVQSHIGLSRETTVVRIPLRSAKHHFGVCGARGTRPANEDTYQAGVIDIPAFARRAPLSLTIGARSAAAKGNAGDVEKGKREAVEENRGADSANGDPQVFYFGVFDGHGGIECSEYLRDYLHEYVQDAAVAFEMQSSLQKGIATGRTATRRLPWTRSRVMEAGKSSGVEAETESGNSTHSKNHETLPLQGDLPIIQPANRQKIVELEKELVVNWKNLVGGYYRRFRPQHFSCFDENRTSSSSAHSHSHSHTHAHNHAHGHSHALSHALSHGHSHSHYTTTTQGATIEEMLEYAFLKADFDFIAAQALKQGDDPVQAEKPLNESDILHNPSRARYPMLGGPHRFKGGSTASIAMISTPSPTPFWHPSSPSSLVVSHVGDTRILLCSTATGLAIPLTTDHHPSSPIEGSRLRRYAAAFVTDSFGEERMSGLANTRAFGDMQSKRIGVSAEPEVRRVEMGPAEYSFLVLMTDGVSGAMSDQEVVDVVKEAKTPDEGARNVVGFATEVGADGDNATCLVVRLGGWERRLEGGLGSMGTREEREWRRVEATDPRRKRR
ncbi:phosphatase 2c [Paracoccidioides lutzii Pb01]|uniref:Phosphatase 2c n=1 Tax=Paracoccidioides lutzii (strain ATCC MYA-826 / Pb01) TaxID=502779 RepID=C1H3I2_PARBA|nr:phosphatase 2c [Paracoccidioides lutzii Pb01]EEH34276.2 phosphatase 2c [Paracoccidioides lutzii Pb01]